VLSNLFNDKKLENFNRLFFHTYILNIESSGFGWICASLLVYAWDGMVRRQYYSVYITWLLVMVQTG